MNIILVHLGNKRFSHLKGTLNQLIYYKNKNIYLLAEKKVLDYLSKLKKFNKVKFFNFNDLKKNYFHVSFLKNTRLSQVESDGFWFKTVDRFFYLENFVKKKKLKNIIHIENDVLVFDNLKKYEKKFKNLFDIGLTFLNFKNCVPGFMYFKNYESISKIVQYIYGKNRFFFQKKNLTDMQLLANFYNEYKQKIKIGMFPTITEEIALDHAEDMLKIKEFYENFKQLNIIFDACALGQIVDGLDKKYHLHKGKYINKQNIINPILFNVVFKKINNVKHPYLKYKNTTIPILNLHMHSKNTKKFVKF